MLSVPEYQSVMRGINYKEHLDATDSSFGLESQIK